MNVSTQRDIGSYIALAPECFADTEGLITAGAGNDAATITGVAINRLRVGSTGPALSGKLCLGYKATLGQSATLSLTLKLQHALTGGSAFSTAATVPAVRARHIAGATNTGGGTIGTVTVLTLNSSGELAATVIATGGTSGTTEVGVVELDYELSSAGQWVRAIRVLDLSAGSADTVLVVPFLILGGCDVDPVI